MTDNHIYIISWIAVALLFLVIYDFTHIGFLLKLFKKRKK